MSLGSGRDQSLCPVVLLMHFIVLGWPQQTGQLFPFPSVVNVCVCVRTCKLDLRLLGNRLHGGTVSTVCSPYVRVYK